jgi:GNAT superfamily N-acetyltransferase
VAELPDPVRLLAEFPLTYGPAPPAGTPVEKLALQGCAVLLPPGSAGLVEVTDLTADVEDTLEYVRELLRERRRSRAVWFGSKSTRPQDLKARLLELGLTLPLEGPWEHRYAAMVRTEPTPPGPADVVARPPESYEEYDAAHRLEADIIGMPEEDRRASAEHRSTFWELQKSGRAVIKTYVALIEGELVGIGRSLFADAGVNLSGGSVRPNVRGRGVYRALVRARWDGAVERGTPALTVQAGAMSRPILERLGFTIVAQQECLIDQLG